MQRESRSTVIGALVTALASGAFAVPPETLGTVTSEVYTATGSQSEIAARGAACIAGTLSSGVEGGQLIIVDDRPSGLVVANSVLQYSDGLIGWKVRSRFAFEAKEGRFRIEQTNIERFYDPPIGWGPIYKQRFSGLAKAEAALVQSAATVAACVKRVDEKW